MSVLFTLSCKIGSASQYETNSIELVLIKLAYETNHQRFDQNTLAFIRVNCNTTVNGCKKNTSSVPWSQMHINESHVNDSYSNSSPKKYETSFQLQHFIA